MARIILATMGSYGDLFPYLALAQGLQARGHSPVLATTPFYADKVAAAGVEFAPMRPDVTELGDYAELMRKSNDPRTGTEFVVRRLVLPRLRASYADLMTAACNADLIVGQQLAVAAPMVAAKLGLPWVGSALAPISFGSQTDPSVLAPAPWLHTIQTRMPRLGRLITRMMRNLAAHWSAPIHAMRAELGLPRVQGEPLLEGQFSPFANLALFSRHFSPSAADWPARTSP